MELVLQRMRDANCLMQRAGPYVLLELLLPGGTLFALLLYVYRKRAQHGAASVDWALSRLENALGVRLPAGAPQHEERDGLEPLGYEAQR